MKRLYIFLLVLILMAPFAAAQVTTERCFHLDKVQFLEHKQDFWRSHKLYSTSARPYESVGGGFYDATEITYGFGMSETSTPFADNYYGLTTAAGWRFANGLALGLGTGYLKYNAGEENTGWMMPLFIDVRYFIGQQKNKFFVMADGGILINYEDFKEQGRYFANPAVGIVIPVAKSTQLSFAAGLYTQYDYDFFEKDVMYRDTFINLKLGLLFGK